MAHIRRSPGGEEAIEAGSRLVRRYLAAVRDEADEEGRVADVSRLISRRSRAHAHTRRGEALVALMALNPSRAEKDRLLAELRPTRVGTAT